MKYLKRITLLISLAFFFFSGVLTADDLVHVVGRGETVYSISRFYSVSADELMRVNNISDPSRLLPGRRLVIPASNNSTGTQPALIDYRVARGDTLFGIARNNGITLQALLDINRFSSNHVLRAGDTIRIPARNTANIAQNTALESTASAQVPAGFFSLRWPINPKGITYMSGQMGVVVEGEHNEPVRSLTQGNVISAGPWRKFGRVVIVEAAGGYFYMYGGCESLSVNVGDRISPGMEVGRLGINAVSDRPQLFFMVFRNDTPIDPAMAPRAGDNI
jgi:murein DD-endopeptidase MepM/ murein hydrolase activator NlpD